jgi:hypothetical protein
MAVEASEVAAVRRRAVINFTRCLTFEYGSHSREVVCTTDGGQARPVVRPEGRLGIGRVARQRVGGGRDIE